MKKSVKKKSSLWLWLIAVIVGLLCILLFLKESEVDNELALKQQELNELYGAIEEANNKTLEMEEEIRYRATDEYIEEAARDIGLIDPNETIISPEE